MGGFRRSLSPPSGIYATSAALLLAVKSQLFKPHCFRLKKYSAAHLRRQLHTAFLVASLMYDNPFDAEVRDIGVRQKNIS
jgi:hypothetical protein